MNSDILPYKIYNPFLSSNLCLLITTRCNLRCKYCFNRFFSYPAHDMSPELAVAIVATWLKEQPASSKLKQIVFSGGEPTLNVTTIFAVMKYLREQGVNCLPRIVTNGVIPDDILEQLLDEKFYFQISFDGYNDTYRISADAQLSVSDEIMRTIAKINQHQLPFALWATIHAGNVNAMSSIVEVAKQLEAVNVGMLPIFLHHSSVADQVYRPDVEQYIDNYFQALDRALALKIDFFSLEIGQVKQKKQLDQNSGLFFMPDGKMIFNTRYNVATGYEQVFMGQYDYQKKRAVMDKASLAQALAYFEENRARYCQHCAVFPVCKGRNKNFFLYDSEENNEVDAMCNFFCEITRKVLLGLQAYHL